MSRALLEQLKHFLIAGSAQASDPNAIANLVADIDASLVIIDGTLDDIDLGIERIKDQSLSRGVTNFGGKVIPATGFTMMGSDTFNFPTMFGAARIRQIIISTEQILVDTIWRILVDGIEVWIGYFNITSPVPFILRLGEFFLSGSQIIFQRLAGGGELRWTVWWEDLPDDSPAYRITQADT